MNEGQNALLHDLTILEAMLDELPEYLMSDATRWPIQADMPPLTIGGCLMRIHRLGKLQAQLPHLDKNRYDQAVLRFEDALIEKVVRFEKRTHQELHARLGEWSVCLRETYIQPKRYIDKVDIRVVIEEMMLALQKKPYHLEQQVVQQIDVLDKNLKNRWHPGEFVWDVVWQSAYPLQNYWWLYGSPVAIAVAS
ncbi:MAG: hypothetical protein DWQ04_10085 [Chloroflexi bacterium]|nr:MAG: hypothetical protein DWQ04_10085 [Chloroflexota bacterium]